MTIIVLAILIILSGVFVMSEMAIVSARKARLQQLSEGGRTGAGRALALANKPAHFLSTVQFGITVISILSGAMGEATLHDEVAESLSRIAWLQPYADRLAFWCGRCRCTDRRWRHRSRQRSAPNDYLT
jgi:putative hemolysin